MATLDQPLAHQHLWDPDSLLQVGNTVLFKKMLTAGFASAQPPSTLSQTPRSC